MGRYRIPVILFSALLSTILILWSCGSQRDPQTGNTNQNAQLEKQLRQSEAAIKRLQKENNQLKKQLVETTMKLVRVKVERDVLKLELGPAKPYGKTGTTPAKKSAPNS